MKMCKAIPIFILLFTGCVCDDEDTVMTTLMMTLAEDTVMTTLMMTLAPHKIPEKGLSPPSEDHTQAFNDGSESGAPPGNSSAPERRLSSMVVAGISISFVFLFIIVITGFWYARKKSKERSAEINCVLSTEAGVSLRNISMNENHPFLKSTMVTVGELLA